MLPGKLDYLWPYWLVNRSSGVAATIKLYVLPTGANGLCAIVLCVMFVPVASSFNEVRVANLLDLFLFSHAWPRR